MTNLYAVCSWALVLAVSVTDGRQQHQQQPVFASAARDELYKGAASLTLQVLDHYASRRERQDDAYARERNSLLSPLALALSFATMLEGSVAATIDRVLETLRWELLRDSDIRYVLAHSLLRLSHLPNDSVRVEAAAFVQRDFDVVGAYRESLAAYYGADVLLVNFLDQRAALVAINSWVCRVTSRVILRLLLDKTTEVDSRARFLPVSVVTLNLTFDQPFREPTVQRPFYASSTAPQSVESMRTVGTFGYKDFPEHGFSAAALPLLHGNLSLLLLLPDEGSTLTTVRQVLLKQPDLLLELQEQMAPIPLEITLPRFKVTAVCGLKSALTSLGHGYLFDRLHTNMGALSRHGHAYASNLLNAVALDVGPVSSSAREPEPEPSEAAVRVARDTDPLTTFHANRPFIYVVADKRDNMPIVVGQFADPLGTPTQAQDTA